MRKSIYLIGICLLAGLASMAYAADPVTATVEVSQTKMTIGDQITFTLTVHHDPQVPLGRIDPTPQLVDSAGFEIIDQTVPANPEEIPQIWRFIITSFETGNRHIPPIPIPYQLDDGSTKILKTNSIDVLVSSVIAKGDSATEIRPIKPVIDMPVNYLPYLLGLLGLIIAGVAAFLLWKKYHKPKPAPEMPKWVKPQEPPHIWAIKELERIEALHLPERGEFKVYYTQVSECIRRYIELRFAVDALERTTWELAQDFQGIDLNETHKKEIIQFLEICDLIKFAKATPNLEDTRSAMETAKSIITATKPSNTEKESINATSSEAH